MSGRFDGRVAVVTGAARGIGRAIAERLARDGARVVVQDVLEDEARQVAEALQAGGAQASWHGGDAGARDTAAAMIAHAVERHGRLDQLVTAAASSLRKPLLELEVEEAEAPLRATFWSVFHALQLGARQMIAQGGGGAIVTVGSLAATLPIPFGGTYSAAKAAAQSLTALFAMELASSGIRVNAVAPGVIDTPGERVNMGAHMRHAGQRVNLGRVGGADEIAAAVAFLLSDDASYVVGTVLDVDGGLQLPLARRVGTTPPAGSR